MVKAHETPAWLALVKAEARTKTRNAPLTQACAQGDMLSIYALLIGYWSFVRAFPEMIKVKYDDSGDPKAKVLAAMEQDERGHTVLYQQACTQVGISEKQLAQKPLPSVQRLNAFIGEDTDLYKTFLRFLAGKSSPRLSARPSCPTLPSANRSGNEGKLGSKPT